MDARLSLRSSSMGRPPALARMHSSTSASELQGSMKAMHGECCTDRSSTGADQVHSSTRASECS